MENRKVYLKPSVAPVLERAPRQLPVLLARYVNAVDGCAQRLGIQVRLTEVAGCRDPEDDSPRLTITHTVRLSEIEVRGYRSHLGTQIQAWLQGLSPEDVKLVEEWFSLEVRTDLKGSY